MALRNAVAISTCFAFMSYEWSAQTTVGRLYSFRCVESRLPLSIARETPRNPLQTQSLASNLAFSVGARLHFHNPIHVLPRAVAASAGSGDVFSDPDAETAAFMPTIQICKSLSKGDTVKCRITEIDMATKRIRISCAGALKEATGGTKRPFTDFKVGEEVDCEVRHLTSFGAWMDIGAEKLAVLPIANLSGELILASSERFAAGDMIKCYINDLSNERQEIRLAAKERGNSAEAGRPLHEYNVGENVEGRVMKVSAYGAWVDIGAQRLALLHISDITGRFISESVETIAEGNTIRCCIKAIAVERGRIDLVCSDEEEKKGQERRPLNEFSEGEKLQGIVRKITQLGAWIDIGATRLALLHTSELSVGRFSPDASEELAKGESITCRIKEIDIDKQHIEVTCKGPLFDAGKEVHCKVKEVTAQGAWLDIGAKRLAFLHASEISKGIASNDSHVLTAGDRIKCCIKEVDSDGQQISLTLEDGKFIETRKHQRRNSEFSVGEEINGTVRAIKTFGVWIDIGAKQPEFLKWPSTGYLVMK